ncbi:VOC family protein [Symbioplanes lichenis]|uniref:VOC family protein n=1 Tax=Symbioplanes lichenis TaxID=1629072 RepID=UPI0027394298|nr:VOC family protein [Actinoplanes lichenis]
MSWPSLNAELSAYVRPIAQFDGLALCSRDPGRLAGFWSMAGFGGLRHDLADGSLRLDPASGRPKAEIMRLTPDPAPPGDADRIHPDIRLPGRTPAPLIAAGATIVRPPGDDPWWVLADPEGNTFCAYASVDDRPAGVFQLVVKCRQPLALANWWSRVIGGEVQREGDSAVLKGAPDFPWDYLAFDLVPETRTARSRLQWHLLLRDPDPYVLTHAGATMLNASPGGPWLLADPEGNAFSAVPVG